MSADTSLAWRGDPADVITGSDPDAIRHDLVRRLVASLPGWHDHAACLGQPSRLFFLERGDDPTPARTMCAACPVRVDCLDYAIANDVDAGIWGGMSPAARRSHARAEQTGGGV